MTLVQNHQLQLNGNKSLLFLFVIVFTFQSCGIFNKTKSTPPPPPPPIEEEEKVETEPEDPIDIVEIEPEVTDTIIIPDPVIIKEQIKLAVMLPFQLDQMDASGNFPDAATYSLPLYKGMKLAIQEAAFEDKEISLYVIDNQGIDGITKNKLKSAPFPDVDAVIGPLYGKSLKIVAEYAKENQIPFISPLSSTETITTNNEYIISAVATNTTRYELLYDFISTEFVNPNISIYYQPISREKRTKDQLLSIASKKGLTVSEQISEGREMFSAVEKVLQKGRENVIITSVDDNEEGTRYLENLMNYLNQMGQTYDIKLVATREWNDVTDIVPVKYPNVSFYIMDKYLDSTNSPRANDFMQLQIKNNNQPLHEYSYIGYDLMSYLMALIDKHGKDFSKFITKEEYQGLQTVYQFDQFTNSNGFAFYDNKHINILKYQNGNWKKVN